MYCILKMIVESKEFFQFERFWNLLVMQLKIFGDFLKLFLKSLVNWNSYDFQSFYFLGLLRYRKSKKESYREEKKKDFILDIFGVRIWSMLL